MIAKNPLLEELCARFAQEPFDWQKVIEGFKATELYQIGGYNENTLANELARVHLFRFLMSSIAKDYAHLYRELTQKKFSPHYEFYRKHGVLTIHERGSKDEYGTLDEVLRVDGLPVLWTLKLTTSARRSSGKTKPQRCLEERQGGRILRQVLPPRERPYGFGYNQILQEENVKQVIAPILDYYSQESRGSKGSISSCGYVVVLYPDVISSESPLQQQFREQNGIIVPWTMPSKEYRDKVAAIAMPFQLLPKREKNVELQNNGQLPRRERKWV